ncbi:MAG: acyl-CoA thioesterase [Cryomorphaceae bacterium]|nr:MAG: acyl-CoA thioesterase [Cryomorphaceae bacterium]
MIEHRTQIRVRYAETDRMGFVYYGNYATYFEVARVEMLRSLGISYRELEDQGVLLPVVDFKVSYLQPARYDDLLDIQTRISVLPTARITFSYETRNQEGVLLNEAETTLVFVDAHSGRPRKAPDDLLKVFSEKLG